MKCAHSLLNELRIKVQTQRKLKLFIFSSTNIHFLQIKLLCKSEIILHFSDSGYFRILLKS